MKGIFTQDLSALWNHWDLKMFSFFYAKFSKEHPFSRDCESRESPLSSLWSSKFQELKMVLGSRVLIRLHVRKRFHIPIQSKTESKRRLRLCDSQVDEMQDVIYSSAIRESFSESHPEVWSFRRTHRIQELKALCLPAWSFSQHYHVLIFICNNS